MANKRRNGSGSEIGPDTARVYERAKPEAEAGMGKLAVPPARRSRRRDRMNQAVGNRQESRQLNTDDVINAAGNKVPIDPRRSA
ncbi:MAG TPA: hypothetical protein VMD30_13415 [Tepidisphaeraceae bacterium]|nr:hypothetical protein [Tepidisphaeraceae bacterium]